MRSLFEVLSGNFENHFDFSDICLTFDVSPPCLDSLTVDITKSLIKHLFKSKFDCFNDT